MSAANIWEDVLFKLDLMGGWKAAVKEVREEHQGRRTA